jgi:hypothetical protein
MLLIKGNSDRDRASEQGKHRLRGRSILSYPNYDIMHQSHAPKSSWIYTDSGGSRPTAACSVLPMLLQRLTRQRQASKNSIADGPIPSGPS